MCASDDDEACTFGDVFVDAVHEVDGLVQVGALQQRLFVQLLRLSEVKVVAELGRLSHGQTYDSGSVWGTDMLVDIVVNSIMDSVNIISPMKRCETEFGKPLGPTKTS